MQVVVLLHLSCGLRAYSNFWGAATIGSGGIDDTRELSNWKSTSGQAMPPPPASSEVSCGICSRFKPPYVPPRCRGAVQAPPHSPTRPPGQPIHGIHKLSILATPPPRRGRGAPAIMQVITDRLRSRSHRPLVAALEPKPGCLRQTCVGPAYLLPCGLAAQPSVIPSLYRGMKWGGLGANQLVAYKLHHSTGTGADNYDIHGCRERDRRIFHVPDCILAGSEDRHRLGEAGLFAPSG